MVDEQKLRQLTKEFRADAADAILSLLDELQTLREERTEWRVTAENAEKDAERYRWLLANYARGDGYDAIDRALNDGEPDTQLSPAIDAAIDAAMKDES